MAVRVAINGFGRIGRLAFRQMFDAEGYEVVAINDLTSPKMLAHLLKYDTAQGSFCGKIGEGKHTVESTEDSIIVDGKEIKIYAVKDAKDAPWGELNVDVVLECTGFYTSKEKSMAHIQAGAKKVVISAPEMCIRDRLLVRHCRSQQRGGTGRWSAAGGRALPGEYPHRQRHDADRYG